MSEYQTGRPSKYDPAYCEAIVEHMRDGASIASFAAEIGVARSTIQEWERVHPEFSVAVSRAKACCAAWWEKAARKVALEGGGNGQSTMIVFGLKNMGRDDWSDKQTHELSGPDGGAIPVATTVRIVGFGEE